jgi:aspartate kinase
MGTWLKYHTNLIELLSPVNGYLKIILISLIMQVFKFGGASIRNALAIKNMANIIEKYGEQPLVVVVSAMGKTTRALESYIEARSNHDTGEAKLLEIKKYHKEILDGLFDSKDTIFQTVEELLNALPTVVYNEIAHSKFYDRIVSTGEFISSTIITAYLNKRNLNALKIDAPDFIRCTGNHQAGKVNWPLTRVNITDDVTPLLEEHLLVTQGFIGSNSLNDVITLGKEGSDYTAAIFASCLDADRVTIWKDVPGILSADPKLVKETTQIMDLPYTEASEMTYYGASVIHPKTIKPLANKNIPLVVRSFDDPTLQPTTIRSLSTDNLEPSLIIKKNQCLFTFRVRDYTFVDEKSLARIFSTMHMHDININMIQSSAITISVCFDHKKEYIKALLEQLEGKFSMQYMTDLQLITLKNYTADYLKRYTPADGIILEQRSRKNCRFLVSTGN